jgi:hypothetical protein
MTFKLEDSKLTTRSMLLLLIAVAIAVYCFVRYFGFLENSNAAEVHFFIFIATCALVIIAYYEFNKSHHLAKNEFLLYISNRWGDSEIIQARKIIHELFVTEYRINQHNFDPEKKFEKTLREVGNKVLIMSQTGGSKGEEFVILLNLLDFLEMLSYFYARGDLEKADILNTCGNNIKFLYPIFDQYMRNRIEYHPKDFSNFISLHSAIVTDASQ